TLQDNVQWIKQKHSFTFGTQIQWLEINARTNRYGSSAEWSFSNSQTAGFNSAGTLVTTTGNAYASFLLGALSSSSVTEDSVVGTGGRFRGSSWWLQDNYKLSQRITLNLGLRYDIMTPYVEVRDRMSFFNPDLPNPAASGFPGVLMFAGDGPNSCHCRTNV